MPFADVNDQSIHFVDHHVDSGGEGPAIVLSHGFSMEAFGPDGYYGTLAVVLALLVCFLLYRIQRREAIPVEHQSTFQPILARSGEMAHSVGRWVRHPLHEWLNHHGHRHVQSEGDVT